MRTIRILTLATALLIAVTAVKATTLWQIGTNNSSGAEFALAGGHWDQYPTQFPNDCLFYVGRSTAQADVSYILPGPADAWAGHKEHTFIICFGLANQPVQDGRLVIDLTDTHNSNYPVLEIRANDSVVWKKMLPAGGGDDSLGGDYTKAKHDTITVDLAAQLLKKGTNRIELTSKAGSWCILDSIRFESDNMTLATDVVPTEIISLSTTPCVLNEPDGTFAQPVTMKVTHLGPSTNAAIALENRPLKEITLTGGINVIELHVPQVDTATDAHFGLVQDGRTISRKSITLDPVRKWEVYLIHQTHLDIGYTHPQEEVLKLQVQHLRDAIQYCRESENNPPEAQFKWHPEGMWAVDEFMRTATDDEKKTFIELTRQGRIHLDALYAQAMTCIYSEEELFELLASAKRFEKEYGVPVVSATESDVPGFSWGLVSVLAQSGVKYIGVAPNRIHRIGHVFDQGDKPFWWVSANGKYRVLFWMSGKDYSHFHGKPKGHVISPEEIFPVLEELAQKDYPYDMMHLRYNIERDNGSPNPALAGAVLQWNKKYAWPKLIISNNTQMFSEFEKRYGQSLPELRGDFSGHWEDGAASTAADTSLDRRTRDKLLQAETLWSLLRPNAYPFQAMTEAWTNLIMYDEHTWGAWNSISDPDSDFAVRQANYKQLFATHAAHETDTLLTQVLSERVAADSTAIDVYNTTNWPRTELVTLSPAQSKAGDLVVDTDGQPIPSQRLSDGSLAFIAENVPSLGVRRFFVKPGTCPLKGQTHAALNQLTNDLLTLTIDPETGTISSLKVKGSAIDMVRSGSRGLNDYRYIIGRNADKNNHTLSEPVTIKVEDAGPFVATLRIESSAPGCDKLTRRIRLVEGVDSVELVNVTDKTKERRPESVLFGFPLNVPGGTWHLDIPWGTIEPGKDQIPGSNKNYYSIQRWLDVSNGDYGITLVSLDAPLIQFDPVVFTRPYKKDDWRTGINPDSTVWSWVMNNHWETNYKADQEGLIEFRYRLKPHRSGYDAFMSQKLARGVFEPLIAVQADADKRPYTPPFTLDGDGIIITAIRISEDKKAMIARLFNTLNTDTTANLKWFDGERNTWLSDPAGKKISRLADSFCMAPYDIMTIRIE